MEAIALYEDAVRYCQRIQGPGQWRVFEVLWDEEPVHSREMARWAAALDKPVLVADVLSFRDAQS